MGSWVGKFTNKAELNEMKIFSFPEERFSQFSANGKNILEKPYIKKIKWILNGKSNLDLKVKISHIWRYTYIHLYIGICYVLRQSKVLCRWNMTMTYSNCFRYWHKGILNFETGTTDGHSPSSLLTPTHCHHHTLGFASWLVSWRCCCVVVSRMTTDAAGSQLLWLSWSCFVRLSVSRCCGGDGCGGEVCKFVFCALMKL